MRTQEPCVVVHKPCGFQFRGGGGGKLHSNAARMLVISTSAAARRLTTLSGSRDLRMRFTNKRRYLRGEPGLAVASKILVIDESGGVNYVYRSFKSLLTAYLWLVLLYCINKLQQKE